MSDEILTIDQTAEYLKVSNKTIRRLIERHVLTASKVGGSWRIKRKNIDSYLLETENKNSEVNINE